MKKDTTITIIATMLHEDDDGLDAERGVDLTLDRDVVAARKREILAILFDGFDDRLKAAGIEVKDSLIFT